VSAPERGLKCRIVTKHDENLTAPAHLIREFLFAGFRRDPAINRTLKDGPMAAINRLMNGKFLRRRQNLKVLSSDLTAASDLLP
jgi:hypothetical protein